MGRDSADLERRVGWLELLGGGGGGGGGTGGVTDHGALTGLADDDHPQYLTQGEGDARYVQLSLLPGYDYMTPAEVVAGANITVTRPGDGTAVIAGPPPGLDQATADTRYVNVTGDTMTGNLTGTNIVAGSLYSKQDTTLFIVAQGTGWVDFANSRVTGLPTPIGATDAASKGYVDAAIAGLAWKIPVRAASPVGLNITVISGLMTLDGVSLVAGDRVLLKDQSQASSNGIWIVSNVAWTRAPDADVGTELVGAAVFVSQGTTMGNTAWVQTADPPITIGTTGLVWAQFMGGVPAGTVRKAAGTLTGTAAYATGEAIVHNLGTRDVVLSIVNTASPYQTVDVDWEALDLNTVTVRFSPALGAGFRWVVMG